MRARAHPAPPFLLYMHDHAARPRLIAEPSPSRRARSALSALHLNAASSPAQVRRSPRLKTPRARPHSPLGSGVVDTPTTWSPPEVASGMASELEDMASPLMAPARRVRQVRLGFAARSMPEGAPALTWVCMPPRPCQMMTTVSVTRELPPDQREGMLRHLLRQLDTPGVSGRDDKINALRSLGVHGGYMSNTYDDPRWGRHARACHLSVPVPTCMPSKTGCGGQRTQSCSVSSRRRRPPLQLQSSC